MNLRRGVLRLWLVLSLCWIVGVGVFAWGYEQTMASRDQALRACFEARKAEGTDMFSCFLDETPYPASLIGHSGSSAFRLSTTTVSMSLTGSCFSSESAPRPFHHGIRRRGGTIFGTALPSV